MRPLLDTNILLDVALGRPGLWEASGAAVAWCLNHPGSGLLAVHSLATVFYLADRAVGSKKSKAFIADITAGMDIARMDNDEVRRALALPLADFEDALIAAAAESSGATHIVTRNITDFRRSPVKAISPEVFEKMAAKS